MQIIHNYEEGSEKTYAMGDDSNEDLYELPFKQEGMRDLAMESAYEYGSGAGVWRLFRVFANAGINVTASRLPRLSSEISRSLGNSPSGVRGRGLSFTAGCPPGQHPGRRVLHLPARQRPLWQTRRRRGDRRFRQVCRKAARGGSRGGRAGAAFRIRPLHPHFVRLLARDAHRRSGSTGSLRAIDGSAPIS